jgi:hypothetical protein
MADWSTFGSEWPTIEWNNPFGDFPSESTNSQQPAKKTDSNTAKSEHIRRTQEPKEQHPSQTVNGGKLNSNKNVASTCHTHQPPPGVSICVEVHQAKSLVDVGTKSFTGALNLQTSEMDPYVLVRLLPTKECTARTKWVPQGGTNPVWRQEHNKYLYLPLSDTKVPTFKFLVMHYF